MKPPPSWVQSQAKKKAKERVWGPSVAHEYNCAKMEYSSFDCTCMKQYYCEGCDAMHFDKRCPRTVLDDMVEQLTFNEKSLKKLINEIIDSAESRSKVNFGMEKHVEARVDELAERHGNLGMSRRKLRNLIRKEIRRRQRRSWRDTVRNKS